MNIPAIDPDFDQLLATHQAFLRRLALLLTKDAVMAEDLLQDTLIKAWTYREKFTTGTNFKAWCAVIMRNTFINEYHKTRRRSRLSAQILPRQEQTVENDAEAQLTYKEVERLVQSLHDIYRQPFCLHVDGYSYEEIAQYMQLPIGTIKSRIHTARQWLKPRLQSRWVRNEHMRLSG